jgi:hypothetical protein
MTDKRSSPVDSSIIPTLVQSLSSDDQRVLHAYLAELDGEPTFHNVESRISDLAGVENASRWLIGYTLVFWRARANFHTIRTFVWDGNGDFPPEVHRFVRERYGVRIDTAPERVEFVCWQSLRWEKFWILYRPGEIRIWERQDRIEWTDERFDQQLYLLSGQLHAQLNEKTLNNYYRTALMFPPSAQHPLLSWTWHFEQANKAGQDPRLAGLVGEERQLLQAAIAQYNAEMDETNGRVKVQDIREDIRQGKVNGRGWDWYIPPPAVIEVVSTTAGESIVALELTNHPACQAILGATGLTRYNGKYPELWLAGDQVEDSDGNVVARCPNLDDDTVGRAIVDLAGTMKWRVRRG